MKPRIITFLKNFAFHTLTLWIVINLFNVVPYIYHSLRDGYYLFTEDKKPVTRWEYFWLQNRHPELLIMLLYVFIVELIYNWLFKRLRWPAYALVCLLTGVFTVTLLSIQNSFAIRQQGILIDTEPVLWIGAYAFGYAIFRDYIHQLKRKKEIQLQHTQNELNALKEQLNPHFLFNSLNYLYGTALKENAPQTADGIDQLADMLRYTVTGLHENFVPMSREIQFIEQYIHLQKLRLPAIKGIVVLTKIDVGENELTIAPLLLLTFIENAFKYGISMDEPCFVEISIALQSLQLQLNVRNSIVANGLKNKGSNTGISSTKKRLELLYPGEYTLAINKSHSAHSVSLNINLIK